MDAHALLSSQGWRGKGHSLHKTDDTIGLSKPLLLNRKMNTKGLGANQHFTSDQWWMNAFDEQLQGLDTSKEGCVVQTVTSGKLNVMDKQLGKWALYASFVKGGLLQGTILSMDEKDSSTSDSDEGEPTQSKTDCVKAEKETREERRARKEARRKRKERRALEKAARAEKKSKAAKSTKSTPVDDADEEKRMRRARKEEKRRKRKQKEGSGSES